MNIQPVDIKSHILRNEQLKGWKEEIVGRWHYNDLAADPTWRDGWISFDAITFNRGDDKIYCGLNAIDADILYRFDPASGKFEGLRSRRVTDAFDVKIHRTLLLNPTDDCFYFATSLLHDLDRQREAPGGKIIKYDWRADKYEVLCTPLPHQYIQSIALDAPRGIIYAFTYPCEMLIRYDLASGHHRTLGYVGNAIAFAQPHNAVVDAGGWLWGTCAETRAWDEVPGPCPIRLFKYHPDEDRFVWFDFGLSRREDPRAIVPEFDPQGLPDMTESRHQIDYGFCDGMCFDGKRHIYAGTVAGVLCRIDTWNDRVEKIGNVMASGRFPAMAFGTDGKLYGGGGMRGKTELCRFDPESLALDRWSNLRDPETGESPARIHELAVSDDGIVWFGENDNHKRSSYLWSFDPGP